LYFETPFTITSIYGAHTAECFEGSNKEWDIPDHGNFQVYAVRPYLESKECYFMLSGTAGAMLPELTSSIFRDVYDNNRWLFSVRVKPLSYPWADGASGSANNAFTVEFSGYNSVVDIINNSFSTSGTITKAAGEAFMTAPKRFFVGAHRQNFTGSVREYSDAKVSDLKVWAKYLSDEELITHAKDASNFGTAHPYRGSFMSEISKSFGVGY